jgi:cytoskeletal protein RodZ
VNGAGATIHVTFTTPSDSILLTLAVVVPVALALLGVWVFLLRRRSRTNQVQRDDTTGRNGDGQSSGDVGSAEEQSPPMDSLPTSDPHASSPEKLTMPDDHDLPGVHQDDSTFESVTDGSILDEPEEPRSFPSERACPSCGTYLVEERCRECGYSASGETKGLGGGGPI